jgi:hypothetical protein
VRLRQVTSLGPHSLSICRLISTGKSRNDLGILGSVAVSISTCICLTQRQSSKYEVESARLYMGHRRYMDPTFAHSLGLLLINLSSIQVSGRSCSCSEW